MQVNCFRLSILCAALLLLLSACGRFDSPSPTSPQNTNRKILMGGAIQGTPLSLSNAVSTFAGMSPGSTDGIGAAARLDQIYAITTDGNNIYVADYIYSTIRKVIISTGEVSTLAGTAGVSGSTDGVGLAATFNHPTGITSDGINLFVADTGNYTIRKIGIVSGIVTTIAGSAGNAGSADGTGSSSSFYTPSGITTDGINLFVADSNNYTIRKIVIASGEVTTLAGTAGMSGSTDAIGTAARFGLLGGIATDGTNLFIADSSNNTIRKVVIATGEVTTLAGSVGSIGSVDGTGAAARFYGPAGITTDGTNLFVSDSFSNSIRKIIIATGVVTTIAGGSSGSADGTGAAASFNDPFGITTDGTYLFVTDVGNYKIRKVDVSTGIVTTLAGAGSPGSSDGYGSTARFNGPSGITTDGTDLFVADYFNHTIRKIVIATGAVSTLAGIAGSPGSLDGTGSSAMFYFPYGITTDGINLFVTELSNHIIRKVVIATGVVTILAGTAGSIGTLDGTGSTARFNGPRGITTDGTNLFVADSGNNTIRKVVISTGEVTTLAGSAGTSGFSDGIGSAASFYFPYGITTDGTYLFITDYHNDAIRKVVISTGDVTTILSAVRGSGITTDGRNLFVADGNATVCKVIVATGEISTIAGSGYRGSADGIGAAARFSGPDDITTDGTSLFVTDSQNNAIRKIN